jgi:hypothetical protein
MDVEWIQSQQENTGCLIMVGSRMDIQSQQENSHKGGIKIPPSSPSSRRKSINYFSFQKDPYFACLSSHRHSYISILFSSRVVSS